MPVPRVFPTVAGDLKRASDSARRQHHRFRVKQFEPSAFPIVSERAHAPVAILQQRQDGRFHVKIDALMNAVILQRADHFQAGAIAHVSQARIAMPAEIALQNLPVLGAIEHRAPGFEFAHARRRFFRVQFRHAPVVQILAAAHGIGEVNPPAVAIVHVAHRRGHPAFGHHRVGFAQQRFRNHADFHARRRRFNRGAQPRASRTHNQHVEFVLLILRHLEDPPRRARFPSHTSAHTRP